MVKKSENRLIIISLPPLLLEKWIKKDMIFLMNKKKKEDWVFLGSILIISWYV